MSKTAVQACVVVQQGFWHAEDYLPLHALQYSFAAAAPRCVETHRARYRPSRKAPACMHTSSAMVELIYPSSLRPGLFKQLKIPT